MSSDTNLTLSEAVELFFECQQGMLKATTEKVYRDSLSTLGLFFGHEHLVSSLNRLDLEKWRSDLLSERVLWPNHHIRQATIGRLSIASVRKHLGHAKTFFRWLTETGVIVRNPIVSVQRPQQPMLPPKAILVDDIRKLLAVAHEHNPDCIGNVAAYQMRSVAILLVLISTGCRVSGLVTMKAGEFELLPDGCGKIIVREKARGALRPRSVFLYPAATTSVMRWLNAVPRPSDSPLFCGLHGTRSGSPLSTGAVRKLLNTLAKIAKIEGNINNPHSFRHRAITEWLRDNKDLSIVSRLAGHSDIRITNHYVNWIEDDLQMAHSNMTWANDLQ